MKGLRKKPDDLLSAMAFALQDWWTAIAFAEAGDHKTALKLVGHKPVRKKRSSLDDLMTAIAFAAAGLADAAREFLGSKDPVPQPLLLDLPGVKIWYGMATIRV